MTEISVIIPVYNTAPYLRQCLDSVLSQTFKEMEIICVDDGSQDDCGRILEEYVLKDKRLKMIRTANRGVAAARNTGLLAASGKYIGYVDSDDWIDQDMYEKLYSCMAQAGAELVSSGYFMEGNYTTEHFDSVAEGFYDGKKMAYLRDNAIYHMKRRDIGLRGSLCCKLFSRELLKKVQLSMSDKLVFSEDKMCLLSYILECDSVVVLKKAYYHYRLHGNSKVHSSDVRYLLHVDEVYQHLMSLYTHPNFTENMRTQAELYVTELLEKGINFRMGFKTRNLLWVDPFWLEHIPFGSRVALCGAGELGEKYKRQLTASGRFHYAGCIDFDLQRLGRNSQGPAPGHDSLPPQPPEKLSQMDYDYIVITTKNPGKASQVREQLEQLGAASDRILWFEQREFFWKYAQAEGLLREEEKHI